MALRLYHSRKESRDKVRSPICALSPALLVMMLKYGSIRTHHLLVESQFVMMTISSHVLTRRVSRVESAYVVSLHVATNTFPSSGQIKGKGMNIDNVLFPFLVIIRVSHYCAPGHGNSSTERSVETCRWC
jgi:hypothetical protein